MKYIKKYYIIESKYPEEFEGLENKLEMVESYFREIFPLANDKDFEELDYYILHNDDFSSIISAGIEFYFNSINNDVINIFYNFLYNHKLEVKDIEISSKCYVVEMSYSQIKKYASLYDSVKKYNL